MIAPMSVNACPMKASSLASSIPVAPISVPSVPHGLTNRAVTTKAHHSCQFQSTERLQPHRTATDGLDRPISQPAPVNGSQSCRRPASLQTASSGRRSVQPSIQRDFSTAGPRRLMRQACSDEIARSHPSGCKHTAKTAGAVALQRRASTRAIAPEARARSRDTRCFRLHTPAEPSGPASPGRSGLLLGISSPPERQSTATFSIGRQTRSRRDSATAALGTRIDGIEEGHWREPGRALPRHVRAKEARVHGRASRARQGARGWRGDARRGTNVGLGSVAPAACLDDLLGLVRDYARAFPERGEGDPPPACIRSVRISSARSTSSSLL